MYAILIFALFALASSLDSTEFSKDVIFTILGTIYKGVDESVRAGNNNYQLSILWDDNSKQQDCKYCFYLENARDFTDDVRKIDFSRDYFTFPTSSNANIPDYKLNKEETFVTIYKDISELFTGIDIFIKHDSCCHEIELSWN